MTVRGGKPRSSARSSYTKLISVNSIAGKQEGTDLCAAQHHAFEKNPQFLERGLSWSFHAVFLYWRQNFVVPEARLQNVVSNRLQVRGLCVIHVALDHVDNLKSNREITRGGNHNTERTITSLLV